MKIRFEKSARNSYIARLDKSTRITYKNKNERMKIIKIRTIDKRYHAENSHHSNPRLSSIIYLDRLDYAIIDY